MPADPRLLKISPRFPGGVAVTTATAAAIAALALADALGADLTDDRGAYRELAIVRYLEQITVPVAEFGRVRCAERAAVAAPS